MSEEKLIENTGNQGGENHSESGRKKQKIRIKYRQRVKIKKRPKGYKITRYWKKNRTNLLAYIVLAIILSATIYMVGQVAKQQIEMNLHKKNQRLRTR